jgi:hypothetical protein
LASSPLKNDELGGAAAPCPGGSIAAGCVYLVGGGNYSHSTLIYSTWNNTWTTGADLPTGRNFLAVAAARAPFGMSGTWIYAIDGYNNTDDHVDGYNPTKNTRTAFAPDPTPRGELGAAAGVCPGGTLANGCIYAVDGYEGGYLGTTEAFNTYNNTWSSLTADPTPREDPGVAAARCPFGSSSTCIYSFGGYNGIYLKTAASYNPKTNLWTTLPDMPTARDELGAAAGPCPGGTIPNGCVYAVDGYNSTGDLNVVEVYNTFNNTWSTESPDPYPGGRDQLAVVAARAPFGGSGTRIYAIDGDNSSTTNVNEALTP